MVSILKTKRFLVGLISGVALIAILGAATGNVRWTQLASGDRHGNGTVGQSSDGTGTSGNYAKFDASGNVINGLDLTNASNITSGTLGAARLPTFTKRIFLPYAGCNNGSAAPSWDLPTSSAAVSACKTDGTNNTVQAVLQFADAQVAYYTLELPHDWQSFGTARLAFTTSDTTNGHTVIPSLATACLSPGNNLADTPAYNAVQNFSTVTVGASALAGAAYSTSLSSVTGTGCAADYILHLKLSRATDTDTDTGVAYTGGLLMEFVGTAQ